MHASVITTVNINNKNTSSFVGLACITPHDLEYCPCYIAS